MSTRPRTLTLLALFTLAANSWATNHREAPNIVGASAADLTDLFVFISPNNPDNIVLVSDSVPQRLARSGTHLYGFAGDVGYEICIDNDGDALRDICYRWRFTTQTEGEDTAHEGSTHDVRQTYDVTRTDFYGDRRVHQVVARDVPVAPWRVGRNGFAQNDQLVYEAGRDGDDTVSVFAGPREEPLFVDLGVFDLLSVDGDPNTDGVNVMSLVLEVPIEDVAARGVRPASDDVGPESILGVYARNLRRVVEIRRRHGPPRQFGRFVQVSRLAVPLVNEVVIPLQDKDNYNRSSPHDDMANFGEYFLNFLPTDASDMESVLACPQTPSNGGQDIVDLLSPNGTEPADLLRIDITEGQSFADTAFPNGRGLEDDVTEILLTLICADDGVDLSDLGVGFDPVYLASPAFRNPALSR